MYDFLTKNVPIHQNVPKSPNFTRPMPSSTKCFNASMLYTTDILFNKMFQYLYMVYCQPHFYNYSINIGSIYFFSSSDMNQSHNLIECHAIGINSSLICIVSSLRFSNLMCLIKKLSWLDWKLKQFAWQKKNHFLDIY